MSSLRYFTGSPRAHEVGPDDRAACGISPRPGRRWMGDRNDGQRARAAARPLCYYCTRVLAVAAQLAAQDGPSPRPGIIGVITSGVARPVRVGVGVCADCGRVRPIPSRGLCHGCRHRHQDAGTLAEWGYTREDRIADYAALRRDPEVTPAAAAARIGVSSRTAYRYEAALREAAAAA